MPGRDWISNCPWICSVRLRTILRPSERPRSCSESGANPTPSSRTRNVSVSVGEESHLHAYQITAEPLVGIVGFKG